MIKLVFLLEHVEQDSKGYTFLIDILHFTQIRSWNNPPLAIAEGALDAVVVFAVAPAKDVAPNPVVVEGVVRVFMEGTEAVIYAEEATTGLLGFVEVVEIDPD